jgi:hypothetical protein
VRFGIPYGEQKEHLIRICQNDLFDVAGVAREPRERAAPWFDRIDATLTLANVRYGHPVADGNEVSTAAAALQTPFYRGEQLSAVGQLHHKELAVGADDHAG